MKQVVVISGVNAETGEEVQVEIDNAESGFFEELLRLEFSEAQLKQLIDRLPVSADVKAMIFAFSKTTIRVGRQVINLGRKLLDLVMDTLRQFPNTAFGVLFGLIVGFLIGAIPIIGMVLGPLFTPITVALGLVGGMLEDLKDRNLERRLKEIYASFGPLKG